MRTLILALTAAGCAPSVSSAPVAEAMRWYAEPDALDGPQYAGCSYEEVDPDGATVETGQFADHVISRYAGYVDGQPWAAFHSVWDGDRLVGTLAHQHGSTGWVEVVATDYDWDDAGRLVEVRDDYGGESAWTRWTYDDLGRRLTTEAGPPPSTDHWAWSNEDGVDTAEVEGEYRVTVLTWDQDRHRVREVQPTGSTTEYDWDGDQLIAERVDGTETAFDYDDAGRRVAAGSETWTWSCP